MRTMLICTILLFFLTNPLNVGSITNETDLSVNDSEFYALLVAVAVYADDPNQNRPMMFDELEEFHEMLLTSPQWKEENIKIIKGEDATVTNILEGLKWLDDQEDSNDMSLFYITTHGFPLGYDIPPFDEADGTDEAIMSFWGFAYPTNIIWDDEINFMLNRMESQGVCMIVDTCYAGGFNDPPDWDQGTASTQTYDTTASQIKWIQGFGEEVSAQGRVVLMASREDEVSYSGGFAPLLIDALKGYGDENGDGIISAEEAFYYAQPRAIRQHPTIFDNYEGEFPLINILTDEQEQSTIKQTNFGSQRVMGYITDASNGGPILDATVEILSGDHWDGPRNTTNTDNVGFYSFNVDPGQKVVFVEKIGYLTQRSDGFIVNESQDVWFNLSLERHPDEDARICGYIRDSETGQPIPQCVITTEWGSRWERYENQTTTDLNGFFTINIAAGEIEVIIENEGYLPKNIDDFEIQDFETIWINETMKKRPEENAEIYGFIRDSQTDEPIQEARIYIEWYDTDNNYILYSTISDSNGFYSQMICPGETYFTVQAPNYQEEYTGRNDAIENQRQWVNISLEPRIIQLDMNTPLNAIYLNNQRIIPHENCVIIGGIDIEASIHDFWYRSMEESVTKVEFYIDGELKNTINDPPFIWTWNDHSIGQHIIKIIAYDASGYSTSTQRTVTKLM